MTDCECMHIKLSLDYWSECTPHLRSSKMSGFFWRKWPDIPRLP